MRISRKGRITIPSAIRRTAGLLPGTDAEFVLERGMVILKPSGKRKTPGFRSVDRLRGTLGHLHRSTDDLMDLTRGED